jgi:arsenate reductase (glutaredoxin)
MAITVWGIPTCSTVKKARAFLDEKGLAHSFADLRASPPSQATISAWVSAFGAKAMKNTSGASYRALPAEKDSWNDEQWIAAFTRDPMLIKRPVIEKDGKPAMVGFRPEDVLASVSR